MDNVNKILSAILLLIGALIIMVTKAFKSGENKVENKQNKEELQDIEDTKNRRQVRDSIPSAYKRKLLQEYATKGNKKVPSLDKANSKR
ncbi:MAG TPA: hypothetical protein PKK61_14565 [Defluviitaleaceae bacterium]|nr:hypothetical protein [Defluviitaleaceae bacterium]